MENMHVGEEALAFLDEQEAIITKAIGAPMKVRLRDMFATSRRVREAAVFHRPLSDVHVAALVELELRRIHLRSQPESPFDQAGCDVKSKEAVAGLRARWSL